MTSITIPASVTSIGEHAFDRCSSLISITIPEGVTSIEKDAFACCFDLSSVTFPSTLTRIGDDSFNSCYSLTTITIPSSVTSIGYRAFKDCAFLTSLVIPEGVTDISHSAFSGCSGLTSVTIPSSVSKLEYDTFRDCTGLTDVYCYAVTAPAATLAFEQSHIESVTLHVPASTIEDYKSTEPWNQFGTIVALDTTTSYHPLAKEGKVWNFQSSIPIFNNERLYYSYIIKGDTIINDKKYKKLYFRHSKINLYTAALRDEGSRAYIIPADSTREFVYYDLNTEELVDMAYGQSAKPYLSGSHGPEKIMSHGLSLWRVYWTLQPMAFHTLFSWIESIGAMEDYFKSPFIFSYSDEMDVSKYSGGIGTLISCFEDGKCIYGNEKAALDDHFVPVSLTYEAKEGLNHARSNVWAVVRNNMIIFYFNNVQDHFVFSEEQSGQIYRDNITGTMFTCARLLDEETHRLYPDLKFSYRLESDYEVFTIDIATGIHEPDYRPFIEEGKVWKTGWINYIENTIDGFIYHYFDGDSIIAGKYCKKMMRRYEYAPQLQEFGYKSGTEYIGALCEEGKKVYLAYPNSERWLLIYDFDSPVGSTIHFFDTDNQVMTSGIISEVKMIYNDTYHGRVTSIERLANNNYVEYGQWKEGVGHHCLQNIDNRIDSDDGHGFLFISCTVGDEVLYYDAFLANDTTLNNTTIGDVKKQQLDFTHVVKPRPKAPRQGVKESNEEKALTGEYSTKELFVNFKPLAGPYAITICDANGKEVYRKEVQTSNVVGLNTDISGYGKGEYTITVENDAEEYTATFNIGNEDGIRIPTPDLSREEKADAVYDLSGRQIANSKLPISKLPRSIYIHGGKKVIVK